MNVPGAERSRKRARTPAAVDLGPLGGSFGYLLRRAQLGVFQKFFDLFAEFGIRPAQYTALSAIERNPGLSQTRLADALGVKKTNLVALIDALEARGLARRAAAEGDRRSHALHLTRKGKALVARLHRTEAALDRRLSRTMTAAERDRFCEVLRDIARD